MAHTNKNKIGVVIDEPIEFETSLVQVDEFRQTMDLLFSMLRLTLRIPKRNQQVTTGWTWKYLDLD